MKRIVDGKRYDTATATEVADVSPRGFYGNDFRAEDTRLYRTPRGNWFIAGNGGALSRWSQSFGQSGRTNGSGLQPLESGEARELLERHGKTSAIEQWFSDSVEDA